METLKTYKYYAAKELKDCVYRVDQNGRWFDCNRGENKWYEYGPHFTPNNMDLNNELTEAEAYARVKLPAPISLTKYYAISDSGICSVVYRVLGDGTVQSHSNLLDGYNDKWFTYKDRKDAFRHVADLVPENEITVERAYELILPPVAPVAVTKKQRSRSTKYYKDVSNRYFNVLIWKNRCGHWFSRFSHETRWESDNDDRSKQTTEISEAEAFKILKINK